MREKRRVFLQRCFFFVAGFANSAWAHGREHSVLWASRPAASNNGGRNKQVNPRRPPAARPSHTKVDVADCESSIPASWRRDVDGRQSKEEYEAERRAAVEQANKEDAVSFFFFFAEPRFGWFWYERVVVDEMVCVGSCFWV